jgi:retron-type reverse transcriptase
VTIATSSRDHDWAVASYGFRPKRRAQDAVAEIHQFTSKRYEWVFEADIEACFDNIDHVALMDRVRLRIKDKRVLALIKAFLKAGILSEDGLDRDTHTGTPQGGLCSAEHNDPYEQRWVMRSVGPSGLVRMGAGGRSLRITCERF